MKVDYTKLSLEEKIKLLSGSENDEQHTEGLNGKAYSLSLQDGPIGPHYAEPLLWMPSITCLTSTWNQDIVEQYVDAISDICVLNDVDVLLGPSVNIKRNPLCGRNFEYISEDPLLTGEIAKTYIKTLQNRGISCTMKHYLANNREYARFQCSSDMDERTLREIYTKAFEIAIEADPWAIMCSYNRVNGELVSQNKHVLKEVLRDELHYKNLIMSDWGAVHSRPLALKASLDLEMPHPAWHDTYELTRNALKDGSITEKDIDVSVKRIEEWTNKILSAKETRFIKHNNEERHEIAVKTLLEGAVLLKNDDNILPIKNGQRIGVFGEHSEIPELGGGGSNNLGDNPYGEFDTRFRIKQKGLASLLKEKLDKSRIEYQCGYQYKLGFGGHYNIFFYDCERIAKESDVSIIVVGTNRCLECEGYDRETLKLDSIQIDVIKEISKFTKNLIVVIESGGVIDVSDFVNDAKAILYVPFGGEATNEGLAKLLTGEVNPSGKLTESFVEDTSVNPFLHKRDLNHDIYDDRIYVGYRLYETKGIKINYPFGYGLSYTKFKYDNLKIDKIDDGFVVSYDITNIGDVAGKEISEVYIDGRNAFEDRPAKELIGFQKTLLNPGEKKTITLSFKNKSLAYFDDKENVWRVNQGIYRIMIGASASDIWLEGSIKI